MSMCVFFNKTKPKKNAVANCIKWTKICWPAIFFKSFLAYNFILNWVIYLSGHVHFHGFILSFYSDREKKNMIHKVLGFLEDLQDIQYMKNKESIYYNCKYPLSCNDLS